MQERKEVMSLECRSTPVKQDMNTEVEKGFESNTAKGGML
jgi:hypothetical protein